MVRNNFEIDIKVKCVQAGMVQRTLAQKLGLTSQYINHIIKKKDGLVNKTFVSMMEGLGYDVELRYVPISERTHQIENQSV
ncbi:helix-turn-helix transcriptional regulator [Allobaculum sp. JKK-2023]|uniref:helix-turn-helix domain-containing protein n=1 Tax=Allobaculum sp. JKK-2023 TaxID=3108943 RepID=UPI002B05E713|nr:helix-turn-helix transcriptional regulator [Allobaculum sp. JKK-2023]